MPDVSVTCPVCKYDSAFVRLDSRMWVCVWARACVCVRVRADSVCWEVWYFYHSILVCFLFVSCIFFFWAPAARLPFILNANAFGCRLALVPPGYSLQSKSFAPKWCIQHLNANLQLLLLYSGQLFKKKLKFTGRRQIIKIVPVWVIELDFSLASGYVTFWRWTLHSPSMSSSSGHITTTVAGLPFARKEPFDVLRNALVCVFAACWMKGLIPLYKKLGKRKV